MLQRGTHLAAQHSSIAAGRPDSDASPVEAESEPLAHVELDEGGACGGHPVVARVGLPRRVDDLALRVKGHAEHVGALVGKRPASVVVVPLLPDDGGHVDDVISGGACASTLDVHNRVMDDLVALLRVGVWALRPEEVGTHARVERVVRAPHGIGEREPDLLGHVVVVGISCRGLARVHVREDSGASCVGLEHDELGVLGGSDTVVETNRVLGAVPQLESRSQVVGVLHDVAEAEHPREATE
mmetsp:Transcript_4366/g.18502  ORF Transcript_4366/g.18502 Transcript_4366/m.18502 type:complete len:242 (-) Transcript_4366:915-1640(-)